MNAIPALNALAILQSQIADTGARIRTARKAGIPQLVEVHQHRLRALNDFRRELAQPFPFTRLVGGFVTDQED